ncbi:MAG: TetR/AcrR family transcriptional regulator [Epulopiscium sp.]|jgi:AcrR family transcriptional regulator|uniref:TetR family transcriptional regulator n=1 Tax=Defluviitalea raffinosedens TaxID=1450156 RepID=A0A7C8HJ16_9FIRM|nr:TetR/AcrR family transcriptional regulator [Defluviitalea raffinosedens]MBZ4667710.1 transcriptional regulator TetR family [Defluviitaleaceae bacterium]MDK2788106.1 TetR/AcrR family transcriptional regulator [Candidatus Epulonipiscium sp.]KAE9636307.1 TetR family transcriptional regulator [Defluviitalea raffinosedens]MBM7685390.1 AcrR family transcriptional regulator [Defluviitalea raffinosedens]HHW66289.1 TetR/AcrR family transcriptional regulator [Candidatus Epulonipiscium sp.]
MGSNLTHRRESIILNAIELIHEFGIHSVSTKEIARRLELSESTVFKYFPKKNDIFLAVLEQFSVYDKDLFFTSIEKSKKSSPREAIIFYIDSYASYYENYPQITALMQAYELFRGIPELETKARDISLSRLENIQELIKIAQESNIIKNDIDAEILADIIYSTFIGLCFKWRIKGFRFSLRNEMRQITQLLLDVFGDKKNDYVYNARG